jgi:hypothetical protein
MRTLALRLTTPTALGDAPVADTRHLRRGKLSSPTPGRTPGKRRELEPVRVLLVGTQDFTAAVKGLLSGGPIEIIGRAATAADAGKLSDTIDPDVVVLEPRLLRLANRLASSAAVVVISPPEVETLCQQAWAAYLEEQAALLETTLQLAVAEPLPSRNGEALLRAVR